MLALDCRKIEPGTGHAAGRALLGEMYARLTGEPMPPIAIAPGGKPYFTEGGLHFSVSHSKGHVFCALSDRQIGLDAEELDRAVKPGLAEKILSPGEYAQYLAAEDKNTALLTFWVLKEAAAKCSGRGLRGYPNHTAFSLDDPRVFRLEGCIAAVIEEEDHAL